MDPSLPAIPLTRPTTDHRELDAVAAVLASGWLAGQGPRGTELEAAFAELDGRAHAIAVNNCTAGLHLALAALGVGRATRSWSRTTPSRPPATRCSTAARRHASSTYAATPGPSTSTAIAERDHPRTAASSRVDALGVPADWRARSPWPTSTASSSSRTPPARSGGTFEGRPCGAFGDVAVFSLHARKGITSGEGGVVVTDDAEVADRVRRRRASGCAAPTPAGRRSPRDPEFHELGYNYKLSDVLAAIALVQLDKLDGFLARRRALAARYATLLADVAGVEAPQRPADREPTWQTYAVTVDEGVDRDAVVLPCVPAASARRSAPTRCTASRCTPRPRTARRRTSLFRRHLALPMYADLTDADQDRVVAGAARGPHAQRADSPVAGSTVPRPGRHTRRRTCRRERRWSPPSRRR